MLHTAFAWLGGSCATAAAAAAIAALEVQADNRNAMAIWIVFGALTTLALIGLFGWLITGRGEVRQPVLRLQHRNGQDEYARSQHIHWVDVEVHNEGDGDAQGVVARIVDKMTDLEWHAETGERRQTIDAFSPATLRWASGRDRENIPAGDSRTVLVAFSDAADTRPTFINSLPEATLLHHAFKYRITLRVSALGATPVEESYFIEPHVQEATRDEDGRIHLHGGRSPAIEFERWASWFEGQRSARRRHLILNLGLIREEGQVLLDRSHGSRQGDPTFEDDYNNWRARALEWIETELGIGKAERFENDTGVRAPAGQTYIEFLRYAERLSARILTLRAFIEELDREAVSVSRGGDS